MKYKIDHIGYLLGKNYFYLRYIGRLPGSNVNNFEEEYLLGEDKQITRSYTVDDDNTHNGRPLCDVRTISTLSGYMLIQDGDVTITGTSAEDSLIRSYLETGFYYE